MAANAPDRSQVESWMMALGLKTESNKPDWNKAADKAGLNLTGDSIYLLPSRWGKNPQQMKKILGALSKMEAKRTQPTEYGRRSKALEEWERVGIALYDGLPSIFQKKLEELRPLADGAAKIVEGKLLESKFLSPTPEPNRSRK